MAKGKSVFSVPFGGAGDHRPSVERQSLSRGLNTCNVTQLRLFLYFLLIGPPWSIFNRLIFSSWIMHFVVHIVSCLLYPSCCKGTRAMYYHHDCVGFPRVPQRVHQHASVYGHAPRLVLCKSKSEFLGHVSFVLTIPYCSYDPITI